MNGRVEIDIEIYRKIEEQLINYPDYQIWCTSFGASFNCIATSYKKKQSSTVKDVISIILEE